MSDKAQTLMDLKQKASFYENLANTPLAKDFLALTIKEKTLKEMLVEKVESLRKQIKKLEG